MPLIRTQVRNEYGLGSPDLYLEPARRADPKAVLDGVAVSGLVGILRQLGDLAGFAADIFHDLHEQVAATSERSHRMLARVQLLETSFPAIQKNIHTLNGHIHLAYLPGSDWHTDVQIEHGHLLASELPRFLMDSYEECRDPPRLFLLDKFDSGGAGSCLKKYSDPTYFRRTWADSHLVDADKYVKEKKRKKIKGLRMRNAEMLHVTSLPHRNDRIRFSSATSDEESTAIDTISSSILRQRCEAESDTASPDSRASLVDVNTVPSSSCSPELGESCYKEVSESNINIQQHYENTSVRSDEGLEHVEDSLESSRDGKGPRSPVVTWDEKTELPLASSPKQLDAEFEGNGQRTLNSESESIHLENEKSNLIISEQEDNSGNTSVPHEEKFQVGIGNIESVPSNNGFLDEINSEAENYVDALNSLESEAETDSEFQTKWEVKPVLMSSCPTDFASSGEPEKPASSSTSFGGDTHLVSTSYVNNQASSQCASSFTSKDMSYSLSSHANDNGDAERMVPEKRNDEQPVSATPESQAWLEDDSTANISNAQNTPETHEHNGTDDLLSRSKLATSTNNVNGTSLGQETLATSKSSVEIWTNGGLLGLEPSKPPDFFTDGTVSQSPSVAHINESDLPGCTTVLDQNSNITKCDAAFGSKENMWGTCSMKDIDELYSPSAGSQLCAQALVNKAGHKKPSLVDDHVSRSDNFQVPVSRGPANHMLENYTESQSHNILYEQQNLVRTNVPTICKKQSEGSQAKHVDCSFQEMNANQGQQESNTRGFVSSEELSSTLFHLYPLSPPSPPLEHMKISFHPLDKNMSSKLKLEFTDNHDAEGIDELTFPSFQLLPGTHVFSMQRLSSESEDDTFCRSSHYSENVFSHRSETDSEIWEQDEQSTSGNNDKNDVENTASDASVPSSLEYDRVKCSQLTGEMDSEITNQGKEGVSSLQTSHRLDIPGLDSLNPSATRQGKICDTRLNEVPDLTFSNQNELPPLPPLPPLEWRKMKRTPVSSEFKKHLSEVISQINGKGSPNCTEPALVNGISIGKGPLPPTNGVQLGGKNGEMKTISPKSPYEREHFLQQIRNKSFNLRRTVINRPSLRREPMANVQVAAILAKATSIRQAFAGSGGEEDDNWSDG